MNASLPAGIESYLKEAGFTSTEMLVLRNLLESDSLTIRELASKTGKSTGVLDQSMKKLLGKKIVERNLINDQPRYSIQSLDAVVHWVKTDMQERKTMLDRKYQNFESFIASLKVDRKRPDIEYFHGEDGMRRAYLKLLDQHQEFLTIQEVPPLTEEDPLRDFRVELFRKRQARKIFQRVLAPDNHASARFRSRDPFEFRRTLLLPSSELQASFEKTVVGDLIACINIQEKSACLLKYPDLARTERDAFSVLWARAEALSRGENPATALPLPPTDVPLKTRLYSSFREFILSKRSIAAFILFALLSGAVTFGLYRNNYEMNFKRLQANVSAIAATGVLQIDANDIDALQQEHDWQKPEWGKVIQKLRAIREQNQDVRFVYIIRKRAGAPQTIEFAADSDSLHPYANMDDDPLNDVDLNNDGIIDEHDDLSWPGHEYFTAPAEAFAAFEGLPATSTVYEDQWGTFITGYAPIRNGNGDIRGVLAVDIDASKLDELNKNSFVPLYTFALIFACFFFVRLLAYGSFVRTRRDASSVSSFL